MSLLDWKVGQASDSRMPARVWAGQRSIVCAGRCMKQVLWLMLWLSVGLAACIGTILAMFAWTGASLL
jgi:hypothetical protein